MSALFLKFLEERNLIFQSSNKDEDFKKIYAGFDATAPSLQAGNLFTLAFLRWANANKINTIALLGGATTLIGDPTDKNEARKVLPEDTIELNLNRLKNQIKKILPEAKILNNRDWLGKLSFIDFLSKIAKYFPVSALLKMEMFANRLANQDPLNMQEIIYPLMQGYDFLWLYENEGVKAQCGGSDQWCNILAGVDLIKKRQKTNAVGLTFELLTTPDGKKMGKSVNGSIWVDPDLCSPYDFWQYWRNIPDQNLEKCLKILTNLGLKEIEEIIKKPNDGKIILANSVTEWVHDKDETEAASKKAKTIFLSKNLSQLPSMKLKNKKISEIIVELNAANGTSIAKKLIEQGAVKINKKEVIDKSAILEPGEYLIQIGKKKFFKIEIE